MGSSAVSMATMDSAPAPWGPGFPQARTHLPRVDHLLVTAGLVAAQEALQRVSHGVDGGVHAVDHAFAREREDGVEGLRGVHTGVTLLVAGGPQAAPVARGPADLGAVHVELAEARDGHALL